MLLWHMTAPISASEHMHRLHSDISVKCFKFHQPISLYVCAFLFNMSVFACVCLYTCLFVCLSVSLSACLHICLFLCMSVCL